jgi:ATP-binding cassette subfamily B protein
MNAILVGPRHPARDSDGGRPPFRARAKALRVVPRLAALVWTTKPSYATAMVVLRCLRSVVPVASLWIAKLIIDEILHAARTGGSSRQLWILVGLEMGIVVGGEILARASALVEGLLGDLFTNRMNIAIMEHAATLDLHQFEDPAFYDHLERARQGSTGRLVLLTQLLTVGQSMLTVASLSIGLATQSSWLLVLLAVAVVPSFIGETHFAGLSYSLLFYSTPQRRELDYLRYVGASDRTAKEVQLFGLAPWLISRYRGLSDRFYNENFALATKKAVVTSGLSIFGTLGYYGAYVVVVMRTVAGAMTLGTLTFLAASFRQSRDLIQGLLLSASTVYEQSLYIDDLFAFLDLRPRIQSAPDARMVPSRIGSGFVFEDVGFRYPGSDRWAVRRLSFALRPDERVALVGENGAGKTTLTKLIARLYDPSEGRILLDGVDLREYDIDQVRQAIGVIFQDFVRYDMRFDENVGVGEIEMVREHLDTPSAANGTAPHAVIASAVERSLAASVLPRLPGSYRQMLGRRFDAGVDLSGGEWQKIALARAYMRDAQLLILDEPTAALDARAEYDVFVRFNALMAGRMALVISHRFSTVRMADRIIVLKNGEIVEQGTHDELVGRTGLYAELFTMQAAGYR